MVLNVIRSKKKKIEVPKEKENEDIRFSYKEVIAITIAAYQIIAPKFFTMLISLIIVGFLLKLYMS